MKTPLHNGEINGKGNHSDIIRPFFDDGLTVVPNNPIHPD